MDAPTWQEALNLARGPFAATIAGVIISLLVEYWAWFQALAQKTKVAVYVGLCVAVPLAATALSILTGEGGAWGDVATTWWPAFYAGLSAAGFGTLFHAWKPSALQRPSIRC